MSRLWDRAVAVTVLPPGQPGLRIEGLRITFTVEKTSSAAPNSLEVRITNPSDDTARALIKRDYTLLLEAGYRDNAELLYAGDILTAQDRWEAPDRTLVLSCGDGAKAIRSSTIFASFRGGTGARQIFQRLADSLGLPLGSVQGLDDAQFLSGFSTAGSTRAALDTLARRLGLSWSVQDGELVVRKAGEPERGEMVLLSEESGLIGSPERDDKGVRFKSLLQPRIRPGRRVRVQSRALSGDFLVEKVTHSGDTHGDDWSTDVEARELRA